MAYEDPRALGDSLSLDEAVPLATALVQRLAQREGIRALTLKGPQAEVDGLRPARASYDTDVLVDPEQVQAFTRVLETAGWIARPTPGFPVLLPQHSVSLSHPGWSVDIDLHWSWPGFLMSDATAFEVLWSRHRSEQLAGAIVTVPSKADSALILALHVLREEKNISAVRRRRIEYEYLLQQVSANEELRAAVCEGARMLVAERTAAPFLTALGFRLEPPGLLTPEGEQLLRGWRLHQASEHAVAGWLYQLKQARLTQKPVVIWRALFPSSAALRAIDPFIGEGPLELARGWWRRTRRGLRTARAAQRGLQQLEQEHE